MSEIERLKIELEETKLAYCMARDINQFKTGFLARVAHELRSPLSSLISLQQLILLDFCENREEEKSFLEHAYESAQKLLGMIDEIVAVSKLDYGAVALALEPTPLRPLLAELRELVEMPVGNRNLSLQIQAPEQSLLVLADRNRLLQILLSLLDAIIKTMTRGSIDIRTEIIPSQQQAQIALAFPCSPLIWTDKNPGIPLLAEATLEQLAAFSRSLETSARMKFLLAEILILKMGGKLQVLDISPETAENSQTCLMCWLSCHHSK
jgi:signal transduction histidine kinase